MAFLVDNADTIFRSTSYYAVVTVSFFDNDKTVTLTARSTYVTLEGTVYPAVRFTAQEIRHDKIQGTIYVDYNGSDILVSTSCPLIITYTDSLGETKTLTYYDVSAWETSTGLSIPFEQENLRKNETYTISLWAYADLHDGNGPNSDGSGYRNLFIGSAVQDTINPTPVAASLSADGSDTTHAISALFSFARYAAADDNAYELGTAESYTLNLYAGDSTAGTLLDSVNIYDGDSDTHASDFEDYLETGNAISITESTFNRSANSLTATVYTIEVSNLTDYTTYTFHGLRGACRQRDLLQSGEISRL